jgi:Restriction Endonuclease associating with ARP
LSAIVDGHRLLPKQPPARPQSQVRRRTTTRRGTRPLPPRNRAKTQNGPEILAIESKCTETFVVHEARFRDAYSGASSEMHPSWRAEFERLVENPARYRYLDAAQLVKHYLGLKTTFQHRPVWLVYLYWQPSNGDEVAPCTIHRAEVKELGMRLGRSTHREFVAMSHRQLWEQWVSSAQPAWLREHAAALQARYGVAV